MWRRPPGRIPRACAGQAGACAGQALIESAITIPVLFVLLLSFLYAMVVAQAYVDVDTATSLAAASAVTAPAGSNSSPGNSAWDYASKTYNGTLRRSGYLEPGPLKGCGSYVAGASVTCTGAATLYLSRTPMAILNPLVSNWTMTVTADATAYSSPYRST